MLLYVALVGFATRPKTTDNAIEPPDRMTYSGSTTSYCNLGCDTSCNKGCNSGIWGSCDKSCDGGCDGPAGCAMTDETCASTDCCSEVDLGRRRQTAPYSHESTANPGCACESARRRVNCCSSDTNTPSSWDYCSSVGATTEATVDDYDDNECVAASSRRRVDCTAASTTGDAEWQTCAAGYERRRGSGALVCD